MLYYLSDYTEGAHPRILERLQETNLISQPGYGEDRFCAAAREKKALNSLTPKSAISPPMEEPASQVCSRSGRVGYFASIIGLRVPVIQRRRRRP